LVSAQLNFRVLERFDFVFSECGLNAFKAGQSISTGETFINFIGEEKYKRLVNFILHYIADLDIPIKRQVYTVLKP
jgi:phosphomannomutase